MKGSRIQMLGSMFDSLLLLLSVALLLLLLFVVIVVIVIKRWFKFLGQPVRKAVPRSYIVLYGTPKKLSTAKKLHVHITMNENKINEGDQYEYLGAIMDKNLNYKNYIEKTQKKVSDRMKLLHG